MVYGYVILFFMQAIIDLINKRGIKMREVTDICYSQETGQCLDIYLPDSEGFPVFIYFHGGGLESGDKQNQKLMSRYLAENGSAVVNANYRMHPNCTYPDFLEDAAAAVKWAFENMKEYGHVKGFFIGGSSAGGYISQMLCFDRRWLSGQGVQLCAISGFIHDAGQPTCHFNVLREMGIDSRRVIVDKRAPLYHVGEDTEYPPMLILVSDHDMENRYEQTQLLVSTLKHFGHIFPKVQLKVMAGRHCSYVDAADGIGESVFGKIIIDFIKGQVDEL